MSLSSVVFWRKMRERQDVFAIISYVGNIAGIVMLIMMVMIMIMVMLILMMVMSVMVLIREFTVYDAPARQDKSFE